MKKERKEERKKVEKERKKERKEDRKSSSSCQIIEKNVVAKRNRRRA